MARLNIESSLFQDPRFMDLVLKVGSPEIAIGRLVLFWSKAQQSHANGSKLKQNEVRPEWRVLIECGFAEEHEDGVYAKGSAERFGWLKERREAAKRGGKQSGKARRSKTKQNEAKPSKSNPLTPTLTPTLTPALEVTGAAAPEPKTPGSRVWRAYADAYQKAYQHPPTTSARNYSLANQLVKRLGEDDATSVVRFFLTHKKRWYIEKVHDLACCVADADGLKTQMLAGHRVTTAAAQDADKAQGNEQTFANVAARMEARRLAKEATDAAE